MTCIIDGLVPFPNQNLKDGINGIRVSSIIIVAFFRSLMSAERKERGKRSTFDTPS